jgi:hypothetical protein
VVKEAAGSTPGTSEGFFPEKKRLGGGELKLLSTRVQLFVFQICGGPGAGAAGVEGMRLSNASKSKSPPSH